MTPLLSVKNVTKTFPAGRGKNGKKVRVHAVNNISFDIYPGETFLSPEHRQPARRQ